MSANSIRYTPFNVAKAITLNEIAIAVATATSLVNCNIQLWLYNTAAATTAWQPTTLVTGPGAGGSLGEITNITTTGTKAITDLNLTIPAGTYLVAMQISSYTGTLNVYGIGSQVATGGAVVLTGTNFFTHQMVQTGVTYASATPPVNPAWTTGTTWAASGHPNWTVAKWTVN
jgi:hypothetical protein